MTLRSKSCTKVTPVIPVCSIPSLYKLLSYIRRLQPTFQSADQAGFRPGYSTTDHVFHIPAVRTESCRVATDPLDLSERLHTAEHSSIWKALREHGVEDTQGASVHADVKGNEVNPSGVPNRVSRSARVCSMRSCSPR